MLNEQINKKKLNNIKKKSKRRVQFKDISSDGNNIPITTNINNVNNVNNVNNTKKEKFSSSSTYEDIIDTLSISPSASDPSAVSWKDQLNDYIILFLKYTFLVALLTLNFLGLSVSLNCNADQEMFTRVASAIFAFFFGFVYLLINYYTYKVMSQGKMCKMNREKLFPFKV
jgi:hypothetical protein